MGEIRHFCPKCRALRGMAITEVRRERADAAGNQRRIVTTNYHCDTCHSFVRSTRMDQPAGQGKFGEQ